MLVLPLLLPPLLLLVLPLLQQLQLPLLVPLLLPLLLLLVLPQLLPLLLPLLLLLLLLLQLLLLLLLVVAVREPCLVRVWCLVHHCLDKRATSLGCWSPVPAQLQLMPDCSGVGMRMNGLGPREGGVLLACKRIACGPRCQQLPQLMCRRVASLARRLPRNSLPELLPLMGRKVVPRKRVSVSA